jgi:hypothetical protein
MNTTTFVKSTMLATLLTSTISLHAAEPDFSGWALDCDLRDGTVVTLPPGIHHVYPDKLPRKFLHISNNDDGDKRILFDLSGKENITIEGNGAELRVHGRLIPFYMKNAKLITIRNLVIDWEHPFYAQAEVVDAGKDWLDVQFQKEYPVEIVDEALYAVNPDMPDPVHFENINFIDPERGEQAYQSTDEYGALKQGNYTASRRNARTVRIKSRLFRNKPVKGQIAVFHYAGRTSPAVSVQSSEEIRIENVTQYHAGAIANIFEGSRNVIIHKMVMKPRPASGRWYSALNDATHHVDCSGLIQITDSLFEFQGDDAVNIHGIYRTIDQATRDNGLRLRLNHFQQFGVETIDPGDSIALCDRDTLETLAIATVTEVAPSDHQITEFHFADPLPELDWYHVVAMRHETNVNVVISGNTFRNNRARGILLKTYGPVRIHDNLFHTPGPAVMTGYGTTGKWFESGPVDDVEIFKNTFDQCMFGQWGSALFALGPSQGNRPTSKNIRIHNNRIIQIAKPLVSVRNVENFEFYDNDIVPGTDYPQRQTGADNLQIGRGVTTGRIEE